MWDDPCSWCRWPMDIKDHVLIRIENYWFHEQCAKWLLGVMEHGTK